MEMDESGKVRTVPHTAGQWACHVYIVGNANGYLPITRTGEFNPKANEQIQMLTEKLKKRCPKIQPIEEPHLSLSKTFYAKHWHLERLQEGLTVAMKGFTLHQIIFDRLTRYGNEEGTRSFLALDCDKATSQSLEPAIDAIDQVLRRFGFESFYAV